MPTGLPVAFPAAGSNPPIIGSMWPLFLCQLFPQWPSLLPIRLRQLEQLSSSLQLRLTQIVVLRTSPTLAHGQAQIHRSLLLVLLVWLRRCPEGPPPSLSN